MKLIRCNNGHFYDQDKFSSCPNCNGGNAAADSMTEAFQAPLRQQVHPSPMPFQELPVSVQGDFESLVNPEVDVTLPLNQEAAMKDINSVFTPANKDEDYTVAMMPGGRVVSTSGLKPVAGWLVCLSGEHTGRDFRLVQGKNFIGRDESMDICLAHEKTVSREKHALIVYEPKHHEYLIQSGESRELTYVNDKVILESTILHAMDEILIGEVKLLFVPLCSETFNWEDVLDKKIRNEEKDEREQD